MTDAEREAMYRTVSMPDTPAMTASRLPDVVNNGYATRKEREASDALMMIMRAYERNRPLLLTIVVDGIREWRRVARPQFRPFGVTDEKIDEMFSTFVAWAGVNPAMQLLQLQGVEQIAKTTLWDRRERTQRSLIEGLRAAKKELRAEQRKRGH
jgi:hypothetical protein